ncbi:MAG: hypothetical protein KKA73_23275 [Chloroflexi bacterium]|nr:hypothetical protein [Chloroflexota bacterium]MBU1750613.1 hypothetical protein [Chloroflexota bacterium]
MTRKQSYILLLVAVLALSGTVACGFANPCNLGGGGAASPVAGQPGAQPTQAAGQPAQPGAQVTQPAGQPGGQAPSVGSTEVKSFRFSFAAQGLGSEEEGGIEMGGEWTTEGMHMVTTMRMGDQEVQTDIYYVGGYEYVKDPTGQWHKTEMEDDFAEFLQNSNPNSSFAETMPDMTPVGLETIHGVPCTKYQTTVTVPGGEGVGTIQGVGTLYLGVADGLVYRWEGENSAQGTGVKIIMDYWDYNTSIVIEPPI